MRGRWNRLPFLSADIRVQLVGRCAVVAFGLGNNSEPMFCASKEVLVKVLTKGVRRALLLHCAPGGNSGTSHYDNLVS